MYVLRKRLSGLTQDEVAERVGINRSVISELESGRVPWTPDRVSALAKAFEMKPAEFERALDAIITEQSIPWRQRRARSKQESQQTAPSPHRAPPGRGIPIINSTNGGPPSETVDPGQDHYQRLPITPEIVGDPDAFAVTLHGDSMEPDFHEGDVLVFAPSAEVQDGDECFVGFRTGEHTFKRVYDLGDGRLELRPLNTRRHRTQVVSTEADTGVARVVKLVGRYQQWNWKKRGG